MADPILVANGTYLVLTPLSGFASLQLTPYSARGLTQTWQLLKAGGGGGAAWLRRDVNAVLRNTSDTRFRKYTSTVTCNDGETPYLDNAWIGEVCEVSCVFELNYPTGGTPQRPVVSGSSRTEGTVTFYRPKLTMMVEDIRVSLPEWQARYNWQIDFLEI